MRKPKSKSSSEENITEILKDSYGFKQELVYEISEEMLFNLEEKINALLEYLSKIKSTKVEIIRQNLLDLFDKKYKTKIEFEFQELNAIGKSFKTEDMDHKFRHKLRLVTTYLGWIKYGRIVVNFKNYIHEYSCFLNDKTWNNDETIDLNSNFKVVAIITEQKESFSSSRFVSNKKTDTFKNSSNVFLYTVLDMENGDKLVMTLIPYIGENLEIPSYSHLFLSGDLKISEITTGCLYLSNKTNSQIVLNILLYFHALSFLFLTRYFKRKEPSYIETKNRVSGYLKADKAGNSVWINGYSKGGKKDE